MQKINAKKYFESVAKIKRLDVAIGEGDKIKFSLGSDTDNVETRTGHTLEDSYTELLKTTSKEFTSTTGVDITVNNGIGKQRVLGIKVAGDEVDGIKTKCIIKNNGISYNFYKSLEDKNNNTVAELGINDTFELTSDCMYKFIIDGTPYTVDKTVNKPIATADRINIFSVGETIGASEFKINVPINKFAELENRLQALENVTIEECLK